MEAIPHEIQHTNQKNGKKFEESGAVSRRQKQHTTWQKYYKEAAISLHKTNPP